MPSDTQPLKPEKRTCPESNHGRCEQAPDAGAFFEAALDELIAGITPQNRHAAVDWGPPQGKET